MADRQKQWSFTISAYTPTIAAHKAGEELERIGFGPDIPQRQYRITVEDITEEPQWWYWCPDDGWSTTMNEGWGGAIDLDGNLKWCRVFGTTFTRYEMSGKVHDALVKAGMP